MHFIILYNNIINKDGRILKNRAQAKEVFLKLTIQNVIKRLEQKLKSNPSKKMCNFKNIYHKQHKICLKCINAKKITYNIMFYILIGYYSKTYNNIFKIS